MAGAVSVFMEDLDKLLDEMERKDPDWLTLEGQPLELVLEREFTKEEIQGVLIALREAYGHRFKVTHNPATGRIIYEPLLVS